jgi:hypothetical protein
MTHCLNCGQELTGRFCPNCGQRADTGRLDAHGLIAPILETLNWERGLVHTVVALARRPGATINDYLAGRRAGYVSPVKFLVIAVSLALLALWLIGSPDMAQSADASLQAEINRVMERYGNALLLATVPLFALATWAVFRARRLNVAEHLALNAYVFGQQNVLSLWTILLQWVAPAVATVTAAVYLAVCVSYFALVLKQTLARRWWSAIVAALTITIVVYAIFFVAMTVIIVVSSPQLLQELGA